MKAVLRREAKALGRSLPALRSARREVLQRKLVIGASNDPLELEADRVADQVVKSGDAAPTIGHTSDRSAGQAQAVPLSVERALTTSGKPLSWNLRLDMERRFGHDFSRVRVHTDAAAAASAREVNARAYTVGDAIVFGAEQFAPESERGRRLIAHELTHVAQERGGNVVRRSILYPRATVTANDDPINRYMRNDDSLALTTLTINGAAQFTADSLQKAFNPTAVEPKSTPPPASSGSGSGAGSGSGSGTTAPPAQCGFKDFDVKISANIRLPRPPADGRWGPNVVERGNISRGGLPPTCRQKDRMSVVMKGEPDSGQFYDWMKANEDQHASDIRRASDELLVRDHAAVLALRGSGPDAETCRANLYEQLVRLPDNVRLFFERVRTEVAGRDVPGGHKFDSTLQDRNDCDNLSILLKKTPPPRGSR